MASSEHPRQIIHDFLPLDVCKELIFIHKSNCTVGYRPHVFSTTLSHLIATNSSHLIMPFIPLREKLKEKVEEVFGCEYELSVEFTGLISWTKGASIGWHSDDNRPYLKQRDFTVVCYLNSYAEDFKGGVFHFQDGEPANFLPMAGDLVLYSADSRNTHCVDEITDGERVTLTLWFSRNSSYDEDAKLISLLGQNVLDNGPVSYIPLPASSNMYWFSSDEDSHHQGFDICFARLFFLGYDIYPSQGKNCLLEVHSYSDITDVFTKPLKLAREDELFSKEFANLLHALQAVQFYYWRQSQLQQCEVVRDSNEVVLLSQAQKEDVRELKRVFLSSMQLDEMIFCCPSNGKSRELHFVWADFSAAVTLWEEYTFKLHKELLMHLPFWKDNTSLFSVSFPVDEECM